MLVMIIHFVSLKGEYYHHNPLQEGNTALIRSIKQGSTNISSLLIDAGADKETKDSVRQAALIN